MPLNTYDQALSAALETKTWRSIGPELLRVGDYVKVRPAAGSAGYVEAFATKDGYITVTLRFDNQPKFYLFGPKVTRRETWLCNYDLNWRLWATSSEIAARSKKPKA